GLPGVETFGRLPQRSPLLGFRQSGLNDPRNACGDLVLHDKDVGEIAVVALGPDVRARERVDKLGRDPYPVAAPAYAAFEDIADAQFAPDPFHIDALALVGEARIARDDEQPTDAREGGDDVLDHTIGEVFLLRIAAHVLERQYRDRWFVRQRQRC